MQLWHGSVLNDADVMRIPRESAKVELSDIELDPSRLETNAVKLAFTVDTNTYFKSQYALANRLRLLSSIDIVFVFTRKYPGRSQHLHILNREGYRYVLVETLVISGAHGYLTSLAYRVINRALPPVWPVWHIKALRRKWRRMLSREALDAVVLPAQNRFDQPILATESRRLGVPVVICPLWMAGPNEQFEALRSNVSHRLDKFMNRLIGRLFPAWVSEHSDSDNRILALPWGEVLARQVSGLPADMPWILHSGDSDVICVESNHMLSLGISSGLDPKKLRITGSVFHDIMVESSPKLRTFNRTITGERIVEVLTALPPDMFKSRGDYCLDFSSYEELVTGWLEGLKSLSDVRVIVSQHPTAPENADWQRLFPEYVWTRTPIEVLLPNADVFVASISATIQWARACGLPVINYDVYGYSYPDYLNDQSVKHCVEVQGFWSALSQVVDGVRGGQIEVQKDADWGDLDGNAAERILQAIKEISEPHKNLCID